MKPCEGTFAENALKHGVAGLAIDACRIETNWELESSVRMGHKNKPTKSDGITGWNGKQMHAEPHINGRFPANLIRDNSPEVLAGFPETKSPKPYVFSGKKSGGFTNGDIGNGIGHEKEYGDSGSAARFFHAVEEYEIEGEET
jgi:site-specific DNA-methyltransferase (adenine-specific)